MKQLLSSPSGSSGLRVEKAESAPTPGRFPSTKANPIPHRHPSNSFYSLQDPSSGHVSLFWLSLSLKKTTCYILWLLWYFPVCLFLIFDIRTFRRGKKKRKQWSLVQKLSFLTVWHQTTHDISPLLDLKWTSWQIMALWVVGNTQYHHR